LQRLKSTPFAKKGPLTNRLKWKSIEQALGACYSPFPLFSPSLPAAPCPSNAIPFLTQVVARRDWKSRSRNLENRRRCGKEAAGGRQGGRNRAEDNCIVIASFELRTPAERNVGKRSRVRLLGAESRLTRFFSSAPSGRDYAPVPN